MKKTVIMLSGFKGAGKDTTAEILGRKLVSYDNSIEYKALATPIKQAASAVFGIPYEILEGKTPENRKLREQQHEFWSTVIPNFTPRLSLTMLGTDILRQYIHDDLWILRMQQDILATVNNTIIITDLREPNEETKIEQFCHDNAINVYHIRINRDNPDWYHDGLNIIKTFKEEQWDSEFRQLNVHPSEWKQLLLTPDYIIDNTLPDYEEHILSQLKDIPVK